MSENFVWETTSKFFEGTAQEVLIRMMKEKRMTRETLAEIVGCDTRTIQRMRTTGEVGVDTTLAVCLALELPFFMAVSLASKYGVLDKPSQAQHFLTNYPNNVN